MMRLINLLKKLGRPLIALMLFCLIFAPLVYFYGPKLQIKGFAPFVSESVRLWTAIGSASVGLGLLGFIIIRGLARFIKRRRSNADTTKPIEERESEALDQVFAKATKVIRNRWARTGRGVYGLPWYLVLGEMESGKSTLIDTGDMRFPIDHEIRAELAPFDGYRAANFVTWRVAGNEAVLLELAGENFIPHAARNTVQTVLWERFMSNLQKLRPRRPINGVILAIDFPRFAHLTLTERDNYAALIRRTINDLVDRLGTKMTIHLAFTKLDQIAGFADYFESLTAADREDLFGFHFLFEGKHTPDWTDQFDEQFSAFLDNMHRQTVRRLSDLKGKKSRREAFTFYRTFVGLESALKTFLEGALSSDKFSTAPYVRGVYFMSNRQENAPGNVFLEAVGGRYNLPSPLYGTSQRASSPYFVSRFFKTSVFPESGLAGNNLRTERRYYRRLFTVGSAAVIACVAGGTYWATQYSQNLGLAKNVLAHTQTFAALDQSDREDPTGRPLLTPLNAIHQATMEFEDFRDISATQAQLTLYQGREIGPLADAAYRQIVNEQFAPALTNGIAQKLRTICPTGTDEELELLRVYRMLGDIEGRDNRVIDTYFRDLWQAEFEADGAVQEQLQTHLRYMLDIVPTSYPIDENLVMAAQNHLSRLTPYERVYSSLRSMAARQLPNPVEFNTSIGASFNIVYTEPHIAAKPVEPEDNVDASCDPVVNDPFAHHPFEIPRFFTKAEFLDFFVPQNAQVARVSADDLWVLGQLDSTDYSEEDYASIRNSLRDIYADEYIKTWRRALIALEPRAFTDLRDATEVLKSLTSPNNPLRRVAMLVSENSQIYEPEADILDGTEMNRGELLFDPDRAAAITIYEAFADIHGMTSVAQEDGQSNMDQIDDALVSLYEYMKSVRDATDPNAKALELAIQRAELSGEDPIYVLNRIADRTPAPFDDHLRHIASESWRIIMNGATEELNRKWHDEIYGDFQRLIAGRYPFRRASELDLPVEDFEEFFRPGGILEQFYEEELLIFVNGKTGEPRIIDGQSLAVDRDFTDKLRQAIAITNSFFDEAGDLSVEFSVSSSAMSANISRAVLNIEGQLVISTHGPSQPITVVWPNIIDGPRSSRIDISPLAGTGRTVSRQYDGPWSWLRLYDSAQKSNLTNNSVDVVFGNANGQTATFTLRPEARVNPFFNSPLSDFTLPSHLRSTVN